MNLIELAQIWALKNNRENPWEIFSTVELDSRVDREILVAEIIRTCGALEPVHNTTETFTFFTEHFFKRESDNIKRMLDLNEVEYNPIENFERVEEVNKVSTSKAKLDESGSGESNGTDTSEDKTSAYNEDLYQPYTKNESANTNKYSSKRDYTRDNDYQGTDKSNAHGINGLTTRQDLIMKERQLVTFNIIKWIVEKYCVEYFFQVF